MPQIDFPSHLGEQAQYPYPLFAYIPKQRPYSGDDPSRIETKWRFERANLLYEIAKLRHVSATTLFRFIRPDHEVQLLFNRLLAEWRQDTIITSDEIAILMHPAHYKMIGLGLQALPHIFRDLEDGGGPWFLALEAITQDASVSIKSGNDANALRDNWLAWGRKHGYAGS